MIGHLLVLFSLTHDAPKVCLLCFGARQDLKQRSGMAMGQGGRGYRLLDFLLQSTYYSLLLGYIQYSTFFYYYFIKM